MDPLRSLAQVSLSTWNTLGSLHQLVIGVGVQALRGPDSKGHVMEILHRVGVQGGSTAIVTASVAGLLMIGLPLAFLGEYALQHPAGGGVGSARCAPARPRARSRHGRRAPPDSA